MKDQFNDRALDPVPEAALGLLLVVALGFGGGTRGGGDLMVHLAAVPVGMLAVLRWRPLYGPQRWLFGALLAAMALSLVQLLPLPVGVYSTLPQRGGAVADLAAAGVLPSWIPMTLDGWGTLRALLALATFTAAWALASTLSPAGRMRMFKLVLITATAMALLGFAQAAAGEQSPLRLHGYHHPVGAIGTFANRNHFASLMALLLPIGFALGWSAQQRQDMARAAGWYAASVLLFLAAALSYSRAGFGLACLAAVAAPLLLARSGAKGTRPRNWLVPAIVLGAAGLAVAYYAWGGMVRRLAQDPLEDARWQYVAHGLEAAKAYLPWGSGLGSFRDAYAPFEPVVDMGPTHAAHAHNDLLQIAVEAGLPGIAVCLVFVGLVVAASIRVSARSTTLPRLTKVLALSAVIPLAHSVVDYPLRTLAVGAVFALVLSDLFAARGRVSSSAMPRGQVQ